MTEGQDLPDLARHCAALAASHAGLSGVRLLEDGPESLALRIHLVRQARTGLDLQYYIWRDDAAGLFLLDELEAAAARGVRVRLLLDDFGTVGLDGLLAALSRRSAIEVRLFNPHRPRRLRWLNWLTEFNRLNRRMHNKLFLADGAAAILGGRNIGDEYFHPGHQQLQADLDVFAVGPVAAAVAADFERYWTSPAACPVEAVVPRPPRVRPHPVSGLRASYETALSRSHVATVFDAPDDFDWAAVDLLSDDPGKALATRSGPGLMGLQLLQAMGVPCRSLTLVSAYFVPLQQGVDALTGLSAAGVKVEVITNSLRTNNVLPTHAGYAPSRRALLAAGVQLWEMRLPGPVQPPLRPRRRWWQGGRLLQSSASVLHVKALVADDRLLFIGSMNFDPRSWWLNTEVGLLIRHQDLATRVRHSLSAQIAASGWRLALDEGRLRWEGAGGAVHHADPEAGTWRCLVSALLSILPLKWLL